MDLSVLDSMSIMEIMALDVAIQWYLFLRLVPILGPIIALIALILLIILYLGNKRPRFPKGPTRST